MRKAARFAPLPLLLLSLLVPAQEQVLRGVIVSATPQAVSLQTGGRTVSVKVAPDSSFFIYGRRMLGMAVPIGSEAVVVARKGAGGSLVAVSVADVATEARCRDELEEGTQATLVSVDPKSRALTVRVKYGWTISGTLDEEAAVLKAGRAATLADFKPGEAVGVSAHTRRGKWVVDAIADPTTHYLLFVRGGRAGTVKEVDAGKGLVSVAVNGRTYRIRPTSRTWLIVGGKLAELKALRPGMRVLISRPFTRRGVSYVRALVEAASIPSLPPEALILLRSEPSVGRGRPIVGKLASIKGGEAVVTDILRGNVTPRLSERTRLFKAGKAAKISDFKPGQAVVAVPSATRGSIVYCGLLCDLRSYEAVSERLRAEEAD